MNKKMEHCLEYNGACFFTHSDIDGRLSFFVKSDRIIALTVIDAVSRITAVGSDTEWVTDMKSKTLVTKSLNAVDAACKDNSNWYRHDIARGVVVVNLDRLSHVKRKQAADGSSFLILFFDVCVGVKVQFDVFRGDEAAEVMSGLLEALSAPRDALEPAPPAYPPGMPADPAFSKLVLRNKPRK